MERISFREVELNEPIEKLARGFIKWGENNDYPYFLNSLFVNSAIHGGIINSKIQMINSLGFDLPQEIDKNFSSSFSINEILSQIIKDFEISNLFYIKLVKFGNSYVISTVPYEDVRVMSDGNFAVSKNWISTHKNKPEKIFNFFKNKDAEISLIQFSENSKKFTLEDGSLSGENYAIPNYNGGITAIRTSIEISTYNYSEIINGYKGGTLISLNNGVPNTEEERKKIIRHLKEDSTQKYKQGGITVTFSNDKEHETTVNQLNGNNLPQRYAQTELNTIQNIMIAHSVSSPEIFGLLVSGQLGGNTSREESEIAFKEKYVNPRRKFIENAFSFVLNDIMTKNIYVKIIDKTEPKIIFSNEKKLEFENFGIEKSKIKIAKSFSFNGVNFDLHHFAEILNENEKSILSLISNNEDFENIGKSMGIKPDKLIEIYVDLQNRKFLLDDFSLSPTGELAAINKKTRILYTYEHRTNIPAFKDETSREFCRALTKLNKAYSRQEIEQITATLNVPNVWLYRGGWYHNPETKVNERACRHEWQQHIIIE